MPNLVEFLASVFNRSLQWRASSLLLSCTAAMLTVPPAQAQTFVVLHTFGITDGSRPYAGITLDPHENNLWGVTAYGGLLNCDLGGAVGCGVIFRLTRNNSDWNFSVPYIFPGNDDGFLPTFPSQIAIGPNGTPYGAELEGGSLLEGTVYNLLPPASISTHTVLHRSATETTGPIHTTSFSIRRATSLAQPEAEALSTTERFMNSAHPAKFGRRILLIPATAATRNRKVRCVPRVAPRGATARSASALFPAIRDGLVFRGKS